MAEWLRGEGHEVAESRDRGSDPGDRVLLLWAAEEARVLVTMDKDYGRLVFFEQMKHCGMVRLPDVPVAQRIDLMQQVLFRHAADLLEKAVISVRGGRIRISRTD